MKLTESKIKQIIREELERLKDPDNIRMRAEQALRKLTPEERADIETYYGVKAGENK